MRNQICNRFWAFTTGFTPGLAAALFLSFMVFLTPPVAAQDNSNFPDRRAVILNVSPHVEIIDFSFANTFSDRRTRFRQNATWKSTAQQPIVAFEMVVMKFDAFDDRLVGTRWTVTGKDSADWRPLQPGATSTDGTIGIGSEEVYTAMIYVRAVRLADGTIWRANMSQVLAEAQKQVPGMRGLGNMEPDPRPRRE